MKKKIIIVAHFCDYDNENTNNRFNYIFNLLRKKCDIKLITSNFCHGTKEHRVDKKLKDIVLLNEPKYRKNISIKRFYSHYIFSKNVRKYLENLKEKPDVIYCAVPSLDVAFEAGKYAKKNGIKFIIDIQDLWPEAFQMVFKVPIVSDITFYPFKKKVDKIYSMADYIVAVSETYLKRGKRKNNCDGVAIYLGTEKSLIDSIEKINLSKEKEKIWIAYVGTLGSSYDLNIIIEAISKLELYLKEKIVFQVMGDGPLRERFENFSKEKQINIKFWGNLEYSNMIGILKNCDIAVNPIKKNSAGSIINKVGDYAGVGLPVINTQENKEYRDLVEKYSIGFNSSNRNAGEIAEKIKVLINDEALRKIMGRNNRKLFEEKFDRQKSYKIIVENILGVL